MSIDPKYVDIIAGMVTDDPDFLKDAESAVKKVSKRPLAESDGAPTHSCRNKVYRRGVAMKCGRPSSKTHCEECHEARSAISEKISGISETTTAFSKKSLCKTCSSAVSQDDATCKTCGAPNAAASSPETSRSAPSRDAQAKRRGEFYEGKGKGSSSKKKPSNTPDDLDVDDKFDTHDGYDDSRREPAKPGKQKRKSSLQDGPEGEKGSKKSPYLKEARIGEIVTGHGRDPGPRKMDYAQAKELGLNDNLKTAYPHEKRPYDKYHDSSKPGSREQCGKCDLGLKGQDAIDHGLCDKCDRFRRGTSFPAEPRRGDLSRRKRGLR